MRKLLMDRALLRTTVVVLLITVPTVLVLGPDSFLLMLARSFMRQWAVAYAVLALLFMFRRSVWPALITGVGTLLIAAQVPWPTSSTVDRTASKHLMRIGQFNVLQPNDNKAAVIEAARASGADVLSFQEVDADWAAALDRGLTSGFPYRCIVPRNDCYGIAFFSRLPVESIEVVDLLGAPAVQAGIRIGTDRMTVVAVHARSPFPYSAFVKRNKQFSILAERSDGLHGAQLIIGDLNAVSWDDALLDLRERAGLCVAPEYEQPTFPSILGSAMIPIDHVFGSSALTIGNVSTPALRGSDHRALLADIGLRMP
ncbi:MAG: endonuclease/exonuclease/phosphatase family protein [Flavobacteriales bacterium]